MSELRETVDAIAARLDDIHFASRHGSWIDSAKEIVSSALLAERNRTIAECAKLADCPHGQDHGCERQEIAAAIRALLK